jgi:hypothetical protein
MSGRKVTVEEAAAAVRSEDVPDSVVAETGARVWRRVAAEVGRGAGAGDVGAEDVGAGIIEGCPQVLRLLPAYRDGGLAASRALLVEDHLRECATCRAASRGGRLAVLPWRPAAPAPTAPRARRFHPALAAALLIAAAGAVVAQRMLFGVPPGSRASVQAVSGVVQRVADAARPLAPGSELGESEAIRTGRGSHAVLRLRDGSLLEMDERAELSVSARGQDTTVRLGRGSVIVQAAPRRTGHLRVASGDCTVSVTGTVFSVSAGLRGSRVTVIEGRVQVAQGGREQAVGAGGQFVSSPKVARTAVREEIGWSRNLDKHLALLAELGELRDGLQRVATPGLRHQSRLLELVPAETVVFASLPNYGETLGEAHRLFQDRLAQSPVLRDWWAQANPARHGGPELSEVVEKVQGFARHLGDEIVFVALDHGRRAGPLLLAEVRQAGVKEFLEGELQATEGEEGPRVRVVDAESIGTVQKGELAVLLQDDLLAMAPGGEDLQRVAARLRDGGPGLAGTTFGRRIAAAYDEGAGLLFAADLERASRSLASGGNAGRRPPEALGLEDLRHLIVERKEVDGQTLSQAVLTLAGPRRGIASWLGAPAPMGALEFVSANAVAAGGFVVKSPALLLDDLLAAARDGGPDRPREGLAEAESRLGLRLREDVAETLGGEVAFALDGPLLPTPAWKLIVEVYDAPRLQTSIESLVRAVNDHAADEGHAGLRLDSEQSGGQTYHALRSSKDGAPLEVHYAYSGGYLVAAASRALVMRAIQVRESGDSLPRSEGFRSLLPPDGRTDVSGLLFQDLGPLVGGLLEGAGRAGLGAEQQESLAGLAGRARPSLICAYGEEDRIRVAGIGGLFDLDPRTAALPLLLERLSSGTPEVNSGVPPLARSRRDRGAGTPGTGGRRDP